MKAKSIKRILFVCTGNICRSPTAEGVARHWILRTGLDGEVEVDSAGTHAWHDGEAPDPRAQRAASRRGYDLSRLRARPVLPQDFERFDLILAMDRGHYVWLRRECPPALQERVKMFLDFTRAPGDVPDPYYGEEAGFDSVLDLCEDAVRGLIDSLR
ncbi:low molecular weight protein-tyrosine-phosphatase [Uliginosibacterium sp. H1]|uniref:low molecular weight protein-tyrosine-phosphatase n=1 Tax=Uliginosibacterium sp. H1 TaxID=3114757 RepID=UPI002E17BF6D|nr:low molecular weight protein-tyrosine-phosphatase [Uliginosibacterium sp. H1]